jgi:hypothetical protein
MAITFPASPADGATYTNPTTGVQYIYNTADGVWKTNVWPTNTNYLQLTGGTLTGDLALGTNDLSAQDITSTTLTTTGGLTVGNGLTVSDGNIVMAAGHGIDFSADANAAGMTSELLDDYEEGTWTPTVDHGTIKLDDAERFTYVRIGNQVTIAGLFYEFSNVTNSAQINIGGLPFARANNYIQCVGSVFYRYISKTGFTQIVSFIGSQGINFYGVRTNNNNYEIVTHSNLTSSTVSQLRTTITYTTED